MINPEIHMDELGEMEDWELEQFQNKIVSRFEKLKFEPVYHSYKLNGRKLTSVSKFIKMFEPIFDTHAKSLKKAFELGITQEEVLAMWANSSKVSLDKGHAVHRYIECIFLKIPYDGMPLSETQIQTCHNLYNHIYFTLGIDMVAIELRMYNEEVGLCGTCDFLGQVRSTGELVLMDWKTNGEEPSKTSYVFDYFKQPLAGLPSTNYNKYSFQLNLYRWMIEKEFKDEIPPFLKSEIVHVTETSFKFIETKMSNTNIMLCLDYLKKEGIKL